jgi:hypothetical protein
MHSRKLQQNCLSQSFEENDYHGYQDITSSLSYDIVVKGDSAIKQFSFYCN